MEQHHRCAICKRNAADLEAAQADLSALRAAVIVYLDCIDASDADPMHADHAATSRAEQALRTLVGRAWSDEAFARALELEG